MSRNASWQEFTSLTEDGEERRGCSYPLFSRDLQLDLLLPHLLPLAVVPVERSPLLLGLLLPGRLAENVVITVCSTAPANVVLNKKLIHVLFIRNISQVLGFSAGVVEFLNMA